MIKGLRAGDAPLLQRLCGTDTRIFLRLGALLQSQFAVTEPALEILLGSAAGKALLADRRLKDITAAAFADLMKEHALDAPGLLLVDGDSGTDAGWRVIALDDEVGNPLLAATSSSNVIVPTQVVETVSHLAPALRGPVEGLLAARADDQRAAALEQLRYAMPPLAVVGELMPMLLADGAELVRERAIGLVMSAGAHVTVVDLIRALHARDESALIRLGESLAHLPAEQQDLAVSALVASCARGQSSPAMIALCSRLAPILAGHRSLPRLVELLVATRLSIFDLVRALQRHDQERVDGILRQQFGQGPESDATLIVLLARPGLSGDAQLLERGVALLLSAQPAPLERMSLAGALRRLDAEGRLATLLAQRQADIPAACDTSVHWLIAELCRDGTATPAAVDILAAALRRWLREASGPHLVAILEQQLPALLPAAPALRSALVEPLVEAVNRFRDERTADLVESCLVGLGDAAIAPLWQVSEDHPQLPVRLMAIALVPRLVQRTGAGAEAGVRRLLAGLTRADQGEERGALVAAAACLAADTAVPAALTAAVDAATVGLGSWGVEAFGHLAASPHLDEARRTAIVQHLVDRLCEDVPNEDAATVTDAATDEVTYVLDDRLAAHTEDVPRLLTALNHIGRSPHLPGSLLATLVARLCDQWRQVASWQTIWGPANIQELGALLGGLAEQKDFPGPLRIRVAEALLPRLRQLGIARSLARLLTVADGPYLSQLAGRIVTRFVQHAAEGYYADDETPDMVEVLVDMLAIPHLGEGGASLRRRVVALIGANRSACTSRARTKLRGILPDLDEDLRTRLDWA